MLSDYYVGNPGSKEYLGCFMLGQGTRLEQDFIMLLKMACNLKIAIIYFWNFPFNSGPTLTSGN